jgi:hypothetical protein
MKVFMITSGPIPFISPKEIPIKGNLLSILVNIVSLVLEAEYRRIVHKLRLFLSTLRNG